MRRQLWAAAAAAAAALLQPVGAQTPAWNLIPTVASSPTTLESPPVGCVCVDDTR
jgi:hypothetical protein